MRPVRTARSNFVYRGPTVDIGDLWVERHVEEQADIGPVRVVTSDWLLEADELEAIAYGGVVRLSILGLEPIPPVRLEVWTEIEVLSTDAPAIEEMGR